MTLAVAMVIMVLASVSCRTVTVQPEPSVADLDACLQFSIDPSSDPPTRPGNQEFKYELQNVCSDRQAYCTWPGVACGQAWTDIAGNRQAVGIGVPHSKPCPPERLAVLEPGARLAGSVEVPVFRPPTGRLDVRCEFQSYGSGEIEHLDAWVGSVRSLWVYLDVESQ
jgi:hypothetical protein